ncbi:hypothetical protein RUND412_000077 [Rhizina undulata]
MYLKKLAAVEDHGQSFTWALRAGVLLEEVVFNTVREVDCDRTLQHSENFAKEDSNYFSKSPSSVISSAMSITIVGDGSICTVPR